MGTILFLQQFLQLATEFNELFHAFLIHRMLHTFFLYTAALFHICEELLVIEKQ